MGGGCKCNSDICPSRLVAMPLSDEVDMDANDARFMRAVQIELERAKWGMIRKLNEVDMDKTEFKVGDIVEAWGFSGQVMTIIPGSQRIKVDFGDGYYSTFYLNGKLEPWHKEPSLKLIERPRKTKKVKVWVNAYTDYDVFTYLTEQEARAVAGTKAITQQIEIEVLDK